MKSYEDAYDKLIEAGRGRVEAHEEGDSEKLRTFLTLLGAADQSLRHLLEHCRQDVTHLIDRAIGSLANAFETPIIETSSRDPFVWIRGAIEDVKDAAEQDVRRDLGPI